jgi:hypothetical protein
VGNAEAGAESRRRKRRGGSARIGVEDGGLVRDLAVAEWIRSWETKTGDEVESAADPVAWRSSGSGDANDQVASCRSDGVELERIWRRGSRATKDEAEERGKATAGGRTRGSCRLG